MFSSPDDEIEISSTNNDSESNQRESKKAGASIIEAWMPAALSLVITAAALIVILIPQHYGETSQKWATGTIGLIIGYWLSPLKSK